MLKLERLGMLARTLSYERLALLLMRCSSLAQGRSPEPRARIPILSSHTPSDASFNKSDTTFLAELGEAVEFAATYACRRLHWAITP